MKKIQVIDASVAIKWFVDEKDCAPALEILEEIRKNPNLFMIPELFFNEMLAVFCRISKDEHQIQKNLQRLEELGWSRIPNGSDLLAKAVQLACEYSISGYDALYAATASLVKGEWLTADEKAHRKLAEAKISRSISGH